MEPVRQMSFLEWMFTALGPFYGLLLPLTGFAVFVGGCLVVLLSRRNAVVAAYLALVPLPFLIGLFGTIHGMLSSFQVLATAPTSPKPSDLAEGVSMALFSSFVGLAMTFPAFLVVAGGLFLRTMFAPDRDSPKS